MDPYLQQQLFVETLVVHPRLLNRDLFQVLKRMIIEKYPQTYKNIGYIFNVTITNILDNRLNNSGQVVFDVQFRADVYIPTINHVFQAILQKSAISKYKWVDIGPLKIFVQGFADDSVTRSTPEGCDNVTPEDKVTVQITNVKVDNTICFGVIKSTPEGCDNDNERLTPRTNW